MTTKKDIAAALKNSGFGNIKLAVEYGEYKSYKDQNNKFVKGIKGGSYGPMTVTNAHEKVNNEVEETVINNLRPLSIEFECRPNGLKFVFKISEKQMREFTLTWSTFPTYTASSNLDSGYKTYWLVGQFKDTKI